MKQMKLSSAMARFCMILFFGIFMTSCSTEVDPEITEFLGGERTLRKMTSYAGEKVEGSGSFFFFCGSASVTSESQMSVIFAWEMNDGSYQISSLPMTKIRVKFDNQVDSPTIRFILLELNFIDKARIDSPEYMMAHIQEYLNKRVNYAVLTVKESDWKPDVQLPLNQSLEKN